MSALGFLVHSRRHLIGVAAWGGCGLLSYFGKLLWLPAACQNPVGQEDEHPNSDSSHTPLSDDATGQRSCGFFVESFPLDHGAISGTVKRHRAFCLPICNQPSPKT